MRQLSAALEWQSRAVVGRHLRVYMRNWHTAFLPPALDPITMLLACGLGLGGWLGHLTWQGRDVGYMTFVAPGLCFTAIVPTIDHMNLPVFLLVLPLAFASGTYFPLEHPAILKIASVNPVYRLAETFRGLLLGAPVTSHVAVLLMLAILVPLDVRLLRRRVIGD
jgi:lipooligosaccharide transport system permease protein